MASSKSFNKNIISSAKGLQQFITELSAVDRRVLVRRITFRVLCIYRTKEAAHDDPLAVMVDLPEPRHAKQWWRQFWDGFYISYLFDPTSNPLIAVVALEAVWDAIPQLYCNRPKSIFKTLSEEEFISRFGATIRSEMASELCDGIGIAVRRFF